MFKLTEENLTPDGTWAQTKCRAVAKKRYVISHVGLDGSTNSVSPPHT